MIQPQRGVPAGVMTPIADSLSITVADNGGFILYVSITEERENGAVKVNKMLVAQDIEALTKIVMDFAPNMKSATGAKCCGDRT